MKPALYCMTFLAGFIVTAPIEPGSAVDHVINMLSGAGGLWIVSAAAQSLPEPEDESSRLYRFAYKFLNLIGSNLNQAGVMKK